VSDTEAERETPEGPRHLGFARWLPLLAVVLGFAGFFVLGGDRYLSFEALRDHREDLLAWCRRNELLAALGFMGMYVVIVTLSVPGAVWMTIAGGFLFGPAVATAYVVIGATLGACAIFLAARYAFADVLRRRTAGFLRSMEAGFREDALSYLLVLRLVPLFPFWLVNLVPAFLGVPLRTFALATFVGIIPGTLVYALVGHGLGAVFEAGERPDLGIVFSWEILAPLIGLAVLALLPVLYKRLSRSSSGAAGR
jgi:uncharacterized membrane protein YdjX (TVP38/TMEM64 family)